MKAWHVKGRLFYDKYVNKEMVRYLVIGLLTTIISYSIFTLCFYLGISSATISNTISAFVSILFAYFTNKIYVFKSKRFCFTVVAKEIVTFFSGRILTWLMETGLLFFLVDLAKLNHNYCKIITSVICVILNYLLSKKVTFKTT